MEYLHQKNTPFRRAVPLVSANTPANFLSTALTYNAARYLDDGGAWTAFAPASAPAQIGTTGSYDIKLTAGECNHDQIILILSADGGATFQVSINLVDTWPPRSVSVSVDAVVAVKDPGNKLGDDVPLEMRQHAYKEFRLTKVAKDLNPIQGYWAGKTLRFVVYDNLKPPNSKFAVENADIALEDNDTVAVVPVKPADSANAADNLLWILWDVTTVGQETDEIHGVLKIEVGIKTA
ncbi:MAG: hypothetical protein MI923_20455 [Phycisphaerales bacterium]|nr:hypothetical protein [Phycisphaerales bacterium]